MIENVYPEIDGGRYPAKRIVGDTVEVWADLFRDGHDKLRAVLRYAFEDEVWQEAPFAFHDNDRWVARFRPDRVGRWRYTIEAWPDRFESWREDLVKKREAGQAVGPRGQLTLALGSLLTPALVTAVGARTAIVCLGSLLPIAVALVARRLLVIDRTATAGTPYRAASAKIV